MDFHKFYDTWYDQLHHQIHQLTEAPRPPTTDDHRDQLTQLVNKVMLHFSEYYRVKSLAANQDVLSIFGAKWSSTLERSLYWIAGWRPTTAFHLIYTESSILFESRMVDILHGVRTGDLGDLSPAQFTRVSELQCETVQQENVIDDQMSEWQDEASCEILGGACIDQNKKIDWLVKIMEKADELRLRTLKAVVELLTPQQAVEFLIAAAQLHFGVHRWGLNHDRQRERERGRSKK